MLNKTFTPSANATFSVECLDPSKPITRIEELPSFVLEIGDDHLPLAVTMTVYPDGLSERNASVQESRISEFMSHVAHEIAEYSPSLSDESIINSAIHDIHKHRNNDVNRSGVIGGRQSFAALTMRVGPANNFQIQCQRENYPGADMMKAQLYGEVRFGGEKFLLAMSMCRCDFSGFPEMTFDLEKFGASLASSMREMFGHYGLAFEVELFPFKTRAEARDKVFGSREEKAAERIERDRLANLAEGNCQ